MTAKSSSEQFSRSALDRRLWRKHP